VRNTVLTTVAAIGLAIVSGLAWRMQAQAPRPPASPIPPFQVAADKLYNLEDGLLHWPLAAADKAYTAIDGKHLHQYVEDMTAISRHYRDNGHPQFWGRIIGTAADDESQQWWLAKFKQFGLSDVRVQPFDMEPQWMPQSWSIVASAGGGKTLSLDTAQPAYGTPGTTGEGLDVEAMWLGTGSEADYIGRNVRGKAVFFASEPLPGSWRHTGTAEGAVRLAQDKGAAAIFIVIQLPGNIRTQLYPTGTNVPTFSMGMNDGYMVRDLIGQAGAQPPHLKVQLNVKMEPGRTTATVWGTLPGARVRRHQRSSQQRQHERHLAARSSGRAVRQDRADDQRRAHGDDPDLSVRPADPARQHADRLAVVCRRPETAETSGDRGEGLQGHRRRHLR
jgi:hypothetical protein